LHFSGAPNATASASFSVGNTGTGDLHATVGAPQHDPPFSILSNGGALTIAPGSSKTVVVQFAPTAKGTTNDQISVTSDDPTQKKPIVVKLKGRSKALKH
jgi:hypothetical protein